MEVAYNVRRVPAGVYEAQLVLTIAPTISGGSLMRADAQVVWFPPRAAAEYIDPARYHVLRIAVTILGPRPQTIARAITSQAAITRLAEALNQSRVQPAGGAILPADLRLLPPGIRGLAAQPARGGHLRDSVAVRRRPDQRRRPTAADA
jgi:hypothetical protein